LPKHLIGETAPITWQSRGASARQRSERSAWPGIAETLDRRDCSADHMAITRCQRTALLPLSQIALAFLPRSSLFLLFDLAPLRLTLILRSSSVLSGSSFSPPRSDPVPPSDPASVRSRLRPIPPLSDPTSGGQSRLSLIPPQSDLSSLASALLLPASDLISPLI
jgi:hypothetical protein